MIWSSDDPDCSRNAQITRYLIAVDACGTISFDWTYTTLDCNGSVWDRFGYMINGTPTQLSTNGLPFGTSESGSTSVAVNPGDVFAFYMNATDNYCGRARSVISNFSGPSCDLVLVVEAPATLYYGYDDLSCTEIIASAASSNGPVTISGDGTVCAEESGCFDVTVTATDAACCEVSVTVTVPVVDAVCHDSNGNPKVQVCHKGKSICVSANAVAAHLAHGDYLGDCGEGADCEGEPRMQGTQGSEVTASSCSSAKGHPSFEIPSLDAFFTEGQQLVDFEFISIHPNPAQDNINLTVNRGLSGPTDVIIYNLNGQIMWSSHVDITKGQSVPLNVSALPNGHYTVKLTDQNGGHFNTKLLKQNSR